MIPTLEVGAGLQDNMRFEVEDHRDKRHADARRGYESRDLNIRERKAAETVGISHHTMGHHQERGSGLIQLIYKGRGWCVRS
jgi:hypothetical protein